MPSGVYKRKLNTRNGKYVRTPEILEKMRKAHLGKPGYWKGKSRPCKPETRIKMSLAHRGENNSSWKGGITPIHTKIRTSMDGEVWRNAVFARDGYTCQKYGIKGGDLVAHHTLNFSTHPKLRFAVDNGITLSKIAHQQFHKIYGKTNNTRKQLEEFIK